MTEMDELEDYLDELRLQYSNLAKEAYQNSYWMGKFLTVNDIQEKIQSIKNSKL